MGASASQKPSTTAMQMAGPKSPTLMVGLLAPTWMVPTMALATLPSSSPSSSLSPSAVSRACLPVKARCGRREFWPWLPSTTWMRLPDTGETAVTELLGRAVPDMCA